MVLISATAAPSPPIILCSSTVTISLEELQAFWIASESTLRAPRGRARSGAIHHVLSGGRVHVQVLHHALPPDVSLEDRKR